MASGGDYLVAMRDLGQNPTVVDANVATGDGTVHLVTARTNFTFMVLRIVVDIITHANAKNIVIQDTANTPIKIASINDLTFAAGVQEHFEYNYGPHGRALTVSKGLDVVNPGTGPVFSIHVEGYFVQGATLNTIMTNTSL